MVKIKSSSIGRKLMMSISGMFLIMFLTLHLFINLTSLISRETYEAACRFMDENIFIQIMVPVLALGFVIHIIMGIVLTIQNRKARPINYTVKNKTQISWASKNMLALGLIVLGLLIMHLSHFWAKMQLQHFLGNEGENPYDLVKTLFSNGWYVAMYIIWIVALCYHITHGFWSMFQSMGVTNGKWIPRLQKIAVIYSHSIMVGYILIPVYFYLGFGDK
ncbi:MAG: succinate dehydrogenase cytochrome b subunit [Prevotella sp.]|jgi:succinate dehydrogenase / fumarate reductase cytochrome b subunit|uniref:succinate dehydrogenase cytochrome b subunit n=1 Tax=unclassified Dysgonomonas TaxID=2630389 RepID=UPI0025BEEA1C|nr:MULTISPECIES: succinate dehydrogenase cytochrome b subunit [unclassified Dysgonomonas]MDR1715842.1 succinate dehydrogenase cytochrome b subunit [Prevotella sp.]MDR2002562.1 succinate dehydrogenase cytochrome b subunit [Prevotella sp.]HMM01923.1 succinate dehydrogenase cytochrome b subunit [Dysgonomonas sp.]